MRDLERLGSISWLPMGLALVMSACSSEPEDDPVTTPAEPAPAAGSERPRVATSIVSPTPAAREPIQVPSSSEPPERDERDPEDTEPSLPRWAQGPDAAQSVVADPEAEGRLRADLQWLQGRLRRCIERELRNEPNLELTAVRVVEGPEGTLTLEGSTGRPRLDECLRQLAVHWGRRRSSGPRELTISSSFQVSVSP